ncbi:MAG: TrmH family RNA methyltransferase [Janthinobacterium lividum]
MKSITSRENPQYKELRQLATSSQARRKAGRTLLDGVHLCQAYLEQRGAPAVCVVGEGARRHAEVAEIVARCEAAHALCLVLPDALYHALSQVEHGVDVLFAIDTPAARALPQLDAVLARPVVLLDNLQDPGNLGSILRSAAAAGVAAVYCSIGTAFAWSPKVLRAGMGAHFVLDIHENVDLEPLVRNAAVPVLATSSHAAASLFETDLRQPVAWLFGHEGQGVSQALLALATRRVVIPHLGQIESLNVAASAAVCFFEQLRQRTGTAPGG